MPLDDGIEGGQVVEVDGSLKGGLAGFEALELLVCLLPCLRLLESMKFTQP